ncbi:hypothetical protein A3715_14525 [Oleiphilus sp. HI0009]|nr:hypothetical protein A3715_14525 [Oleiphilus sp. HI0009]
MTDQQKVPLAQKLNLETAQISWKELEPYFAGGKLICVSSDLDMLIVAEQIVADNAPVMKGWMAEEKVGQVSDEQAMRWSADNTLLWAVVIKPWILVQERSTH